MDRFNIVTRDYVELGQERSVLAVMLMFLLYNPKLYHDTINSIKRGFRRVVIKEYIDEQGRRYKPIFNDKGEVISRDYDVPKG